MKKIEYEEMYYHDLGEIPELEIKKATGFLEKNSSGKTLTYVSINTDSGEVIINKNKPNNIKVFFFISCEMGGVGNFNFIISSKGEINFSKIISFFKKIKKRKLFNQSWIEELFEFEEIDSIFINDQDGVFYINYEKNY